MLDAAANEHGIAWLEGIGRREPVDGVYADHGATARYSFEYSFDVHRRDGVMIWYRLDDGRLLTYKEMGTLSRGFYDKQ